MFVEVSTVQLSPELDPVFWVRQRERIAVFSNGDMTQTMRISQPEELLGYLPYHLGFQPQESIVALAVRGERRRVGLTMRIDISELLDPHEGEERRKMLRAHMEEDGAQAVFLVTYTSACFRNQTLPNDAGISVAQIRELLRAFHEDLSEDPALFASWIVTPEHYFPLMHDVVPPRKTWGAVSDFAKTASAATAIYAGAMVAPNRDALADLPRANRNDRDRAQRATRRWLSRRRIDGDSTWRLESWQLWEEAIATQLKTTKVGELDESLNDPLLLGRLQAGLEDIRVRDAVMIASMPQTQDLAYRSVATDIREEVGACVDGILNPQAAIAPDQEARAVTRILIAINSCASRSRATPVLTLLAWIYWWIGDGARASVLVDRALEADPAYNMARLVERMIELGMAPGWAQRQRELEKVR